MRLGDGHISKLPQSNFHSRARRDVSQINFGRGGYAIRKLREIQSMVRDSRQQFLEAWNEFFGIVGA
jgi:hypothetical protein